MKFGFVEALKSVNLSIQRQEVIAIVGDNGAGKSTLGHLVMGDPVYTVNDGRIALTARTSPSSPPTSARAPACS